MRRALLLALLLAPGAALADEPKVPKMPRPDPPAVSAQAWGVKNPQCQEWTDQCLVCTRDAKGAPACSTPGPACLPQRITCTRKAPVTTP